MLQMQLQIRMKLTVLMLLLKIMLLIKVIIRTILRLVICYYLCVVGGRVETVDNETYEKPPSHNRTLFQRIIQKTPLRRETKLLELPKVAKPTFS